MSYGSMMAVARSRDNRPENNTRRYEHEPVRSNEYERPQNREYTSPRSGGTRMGGEYSASMGGEYAGGNEMAFRDRTGRRHYDNGRFAPMRSEMDDDDDGQMNIGFMRGGENPRLGGYEEPHRMHGREMGRASVYEEPAGGWVVQGRFGADGQHGRESVKPMDELTATAWARQMKGDDGSAGPHWSMEQVRQLQQQRQELQGYDLPEVFAVLNMMYSDYAKVAKKFNVNNMDFYVCMARAWLDDPDAPQHKTARYYQYVVK